MTRDQAVMAGQHARISLLVRSHLVKKLRRINLLAMIGPQVMNAHPKKAGKKARRPLHVAKRNLSVVSQSLKSGPTLAISHPLGCLDQTNPKVGITATCYAQKTQQSKKQCIPARRSRHIETTAINIDAHIWPLNSQD